MIASMERWWGSHLRKALTSRRSEANCDYKQPVMWVYSSLSCDYKPLVMWLHATCHVITSNLSCDYKQPVMWLQASCHVITSNLSCETTGATTSINSITFNLVWSVQCYHFVRPLRKIYFIITSTEILSLPWKLSRVTRNFGLQRFQRCRISWTKPFSRGGVVNKWHFFQNFHLGRTIFPSLTNLELALKLQTSDKKANLSD